MTPLSKLFNKLCGKMIVVLASLLIELIILIQKLRSRPISTRQYLKLIEKKNPTICYTKRLKAVPAECRVCLSEFEEGEKVRKLKCQHTFHRDCLDKWLQQYWATCPLCRKQVVPDDVVFKHRQHQNQAEAGFNGNDEHRPYLLSAFRGSNTFHRYL
ncbi:E3 ubiquitin-protein ligase RHA2A [Spatholobus suberectus]|nr:E3 ubiquitin-protein ligase RHA2A [Spatholobus suberectus]